MGKMVQGKLAIMGEIDVQEPGDIVAHYPMAILITFDSREDCRKAVMDNACCYTFGEPQEETTGTAANNSVTSE